MELNIEEVNLLETLKDLEDIETPLEEIKEHKEKSNNQSLSAYIVNNSSQDEFIAKQIIIKQLRCELKPQPFNVPDVVLPRKTLALEEEIIVPNNTPVKKQVKSREKIIGSRNTPKQVKTPHKIDVPRNAPALNNIDSSNRCILKKKTPMKKHIKSRNTKIVFNDNRELTPIRKLINITSKLVIELSRLNKNLEKREDRGMILK